MARKIYSSNKVLKGKDENALVKKCSYGSITKKYKCELEGRCKGLSFNEKKVSHNVCATINSKPYCLPTLKFLES